MQIVESELRDALEGYVKSWMPARAIVKEAIEERKKHDAEGRLLKFPKGGLPWKSHLFEMEKGNGSLSFQAESKNEKKIRKYIKIRSKK